MTRRHDARRRAAVILYQADMSGREPAEVLEERRALGEKIPRFTEELVSGVWEHREALDRVIAEHAVGWPLDRMAAVDRSLLRLGCHEILHRADIPPAVAIDEAVAAANELSTEDSGRFVNGVLATIAREHAGAG